MSIVKKASATWAGDLKTGNGTISTESGILDAAQFGFTKRFEGEPGTNPEELIGAAHAGCFSMALSNELGSHDIVADKIETSADITLEKKDNGFTVTKSHLIVHISAPDAAEKSIKAAANSAKENCPISKLLNAEITMDLSIN